MVNLTSEQQTGLSGDTASGTWRQSTTLRPTGASSLDQATQLADASPFMTRAAVHGQMRTSLTSPAVDAYWQQKRDERKSSLQQNRDLELASVHASTARIEFTALSQAYLPERGHAAMPSANYPSQHAFGDGSIPALRMPSRASGQDAALLDGSGKAQLDHEAPYDGSLHRHSRQGSTVRFAVDEGLMPSGLTSGLSVVEAVPGTPGQVQAFDTLEAQIMALRQGSRLLSAPVQVHEHQPSSAYTAEPTGQAPPLSLSQEVVPTGNTLSSREVDIERGNPAPSSLEAGGNRAEVQTQPACAPPSECAADLPRTGNDTALQRLKGPQIEAQASRDRGASRRRMSTDAQDAALQTHGAAEDAPALDTQQEPQGEPEDWREQQQRWLETPSGLAETAGLHIKPDIHASTAPALTAQSELGLEDRLPSLGSRQTQAPKPIKVRSHWERLEEGVRRQMGVPVAAWGVREVCDWVEHLGLGQYRKRFLHHCIGGSLLLELTEQNLKVDLAIPSLGHRKGLMQAIQDLQHHSTAHTAQEPPNELAPGSVPGSPTTTPLHRVQTGAAPVEAAPETGNALVWEQQHHRLMKHLSRAQTRAALRRVAEQQAERSRVLADEEVTRLRGQLASLGSLHHTEGSVQLQGGSPEHATYRPGIDRAGSVPWQPAGAAARPMSSGGLGSEFASQELAQRALSGSRMSRPGTAGSGRSRPASPFLERLQVDLLQRKRRLKEKEKRHHAWPSAQHGPDASRQGVQEDAAGLTSFCAAHSDTAHLAPCFGCLAKHPQALSALANAAYCSDSRDRITGSQSMVMGDDRQADGWGQDGDDAVGYISAHDRWQRQLIEAMDELAEKFQALLSLPPVQVSAFRELPAGTRLKRLVAYMHSAAFMQRYQSDLETREARRKQLALRWIQEEHYKDGIPAGRLARFHKPLQTPEQRRSADAAAACAHFAGLGWIHSEVAAGSVDVQLDALLARARAMQEHAKRLEDLAAHLRAFQHPPTFTADGLDALQQQALASVPEGAPAPSSASLHMSGGSALQESVELLTACRPEELRKLEELTGSRKVLTVFRMLRSQSFVRSAVVDLQRREERAAAVLSALSPKQQRHLSPAEAQAFYDRLVEDSEHRLQKREQLRQEAEDAAAKSHQEAQGYLKRAHALSAARRAKAAAAVAAKANDDPSHV